MTVYAELNAKLPIQVKLLNKLPIPKKLPLPALNETLNSLEQLSAKTNKTIPLKLKIVEDAFNGSTVLFSNEWTMKAGNPTNILVLINYALSQYYADTPDEQKQNLLDKIEEALEEPTAPVFQVEKQKKELKPEKNNKNILDLAQPTLSMNEQNSIVNTDSNESFVKKLFHWKVAAPLLLSYVGIAILCVVFSIGTTLYMVSENGVGLGRTETTAIAQTLPNTSSESVSLPFSIYEKGQETKIPITLTSYMKVDKLSAVKGIAPVNKTLVFKDKEGKELGKTKSNNKGVFEVELIEGDK